MSEATGSCLCGAVRYAVHGALRDVSYCHCTQCRKTSGHFVAATSCDTGALEMLEDGGLRWYRSSSTAERGFCNVCGASVFWRPEHGRYICIMAGTLDAPTGLKACEHIFVADAADYYAIEDGLPEFDEFNPADDVG